MKLWQLETITAENPPLPAQVAQTNPDWRHLAEWFDRYDELVVHGEWDKVYFDLPEPFVVEVITGLKSRVYQGPDRWLRGWQIYDNDAVLTPLDVYQTYGTDVLEELMDHHAARATPV